MLFIGSLVGMGDEATKEVLEWAMGCTGAIKACGEVSRFMDDVAGFEVYICFPFICETFYILLDYIYTTHLQHTRVNINDPIVIIFSTLC
jgi:hypothetical protein